jgi:Nucleotidyl transferase AbiEii toxin, Type IV TA system
VSIIDNRAKAVPCYSPAYTFVEKLQTVATKYRNQQQAPNGAFPKNFLRHYHDVYCLLASPDVQAFIGTPAYHARKQVRFPQADNQHIASNPAFTLPDASTRALYAAKYQETSSLYYAGQEQFEAILARIQQHIDRL